MIPLDVMSDGFDTVCNSSRVVIFSEGLEVFSFPIHHLQSQILATFMRRDLGTTLQPPCCLATKEWQRKDKMANVSTPGGFSTPYNTGMMSRPAIECKIGHFNTWFYC